MHATQLTRATYTPAATLSFHDVVISPATLVSGELVRRFDPLCFPQKGVKYSGTVNSVAWPKAARTNKQ